MTNAQDYILWRGDLSLNASPLTEVDVFLLSQLSYPDFSGIVPSDAAGITLEDAAQTYFETHDDSKKNLGVLQSSSLLPALRQMAAQPRFQSFRLTGFRNHVVSEAEEQFCALTILLPDGTVCVSYRGTDDTIIGWKENFNLAIKDVVPAQQDAAEYLLWAAGQFSGPILLCGHSKGGNLAVYAAASAGAEVQDRIKAVYNFDGPGFREAFLKSPGYQAIREKINTLLSEYAMVGTLLCPVGKEIVTHSSTRSPYAHDGFTWEVLGREFVRRTERSEVSRLFARTMELALNEMNAEEKAAFIDDFFETLLSTGAVTLSDLSELNGRKAFEISRALSSDSQVHRFARAFFESMAKSIRSSDG